MDSQGHNFAQIAARPKLVSLALANKLIDQGGWIVEPKLDGVRCFLVDGVAWSRHDKRLLEADTAITDGVFDGEWTNGHLYLFDCLSLGDKTLEHLPLEERYFRLCHAVGIFWNISVLPRWAQIESEFHPRQEGWVLKKRGSPYPRGETTAWLKVRYG